MPIKTARCRLKVQTFDLPEHCYADNPRGPITVAVPGEPVMILSIPTFLWMMKEGGKPLRFRALGKKKGKGRA
jgi:hypothetical protein